VSATAQGLRGIVPARIELRKNPQGKKQSSQRSNHAQTKLSKIKMMSISKVESKRAQEEGGSSDPENNEPSGHGNGSRLIAGMIDDDSKSISRQLVDVEILYLLNFGPKSGYQLKKNLASSFHLNLSYGTLYPHLHSLDKAELISGTWKYQNENAPLRKRMYSLTQKGFTKLSKCIGSLARIALTMQFMLARLDLNPKDGKDSEEKAKLESVSKKTEDFLKNQGYVVRKNASLRGFSGIEHTVDLQASKPAGDGRTEDLLIKLSDSASGLSLDDLFKLYVMSYDLQATRAIVLAAPSVQDEVLKLADFYAIAIYSGKDLNEAEEKMASEFLNR
jgi:DNA-binding PadR family transcriptional regulator